MYLRMCLANDAGVKPNLESLNSMQADSPIIAKHILSLLKADPSPTGPVQQYIDLIIRLLRAIGGEVTAKYIQSQLKAYWVPPSCIYSNIWV